MSGGAVFVRLRLCLRFCLCCLYKLFFFDRDPTRTHVDSGSGISIFHVGVATIRQEESHKVSRTQSSGFVERCDRKDIVIVVIIDIVAVVVVIIAIVIIIIVRGKLGRRRRAYHCTTITTHYSQTQ